jgi:hypothetical protein
LRHTNPISIIKQYYRLIKKQPVYRLCLLVLLCTFFQTGVHSQTTPPLLFSVNKPAVTVANEELVDLVLKVTNTSSLAIEAIAAINVPANIELVSKPEILFVINPNDSMFIAVKIFVAKKAQSGKTHSIDFLLHDTKGTVIARTATQVRVNINRNVNLFSMVSNILLDNTTDSLIIPVRISNAGNTVQKITVVTSIPAAVQDQAFHTSRQIILQPSTDTLISFAKAVTRKMMSSDGFNVTVTGLYENSDVLGMAYIHVQSARSNRNYRDVQGGDDFNDNTITLSSQSMFAPTQSYMLRGRGTADIGGGRLGYNLDLTAWKSGYAPALLQNTWIDYQKNNMGIRAGNINKMLDLNLYGRGASVYISDTANGNRYEAGYIDGNNNLLGNGSYLFPTGNAGWGTFTHATKQWQYSSFAVYQNNPAMNSRDAIFGNSLNINSAKNIHYSFSANGGYTADYTNPDSHKFGLALSAAATGTIGSISFNSNNYFSSGYYPGIQRGALNFSERITWTRPSSSLWVNVDYYSYKPETLSAAQYFLPSFGMLRAEAGMAGKIQKLNFSIAPVHTRETSNAYQFGATNAVHSLDAWNVNTTLNYLISTNQYVSFNAEAGTYASSFDPRQRFHLRSNALYKKGIFSLNTTVQLGTFYMGEAANNFVSKTASTYTINIIPSIQQNFFRNRMRTEASIAYQNSGYAGSSWYIAARVEYDMTSKMAAYTSINHNRYAGFGYSILEMGITRKLALPKAGDKTNSLELFVYKDINRNGVYDAGDSTASGYLLYINNDIFISSPDGDVIYKNLPIENYRLTMPVNNGWYAPERTVRLDKKMRIEIPLQRTGTLKGLVTYTKTEFSYEIGNDRSGILITATDNSNHVYKTKTGMDGRYIFYIPVGTYTVTIDRTSLPAEIEPVNDNQRIQVEAASTGTLNFEMKVKSKKIEIKKFVSPGGR